MQKIFKAIFIIFLLTLLVGCMGSLHAAAYKGDTKAIKEMLDGGAGVNDYSFAYGATPLALAALEGRIDAVRLLLDRGANVEDGRNWGRNALSGAAYNQHIEIVNLLIDRGADINKAIAALDLAFGSKKGIELLKEKRLERAAGRHVTPTNPQPSKDQASPSTIPTALPTALPLPTESAAPF